LILKLIIGTSIPLFSIPLLTPEPYDINSIPQVQGTGLRMMTVGELEATPETRLPIEQNMQGAFFDANYRTGIQASEAS
jgi:hypothetical protein